MTSFVVVGSFYLYSNVAINVKEIRDHGGCLQKAKALCVVVTSRCVAFQSEKTVKIVGKCHRFHWKFVANWGEGLAFGEERFLRFERNQWRFKRKPIGDLREIIENSRQRNGKHGNENMGKNTVNICHSWEFHPQIQKSIRIRKKKLSKLKCETMKELLF